MTNSDGVEFSGLVAPLLPVAHRRAFSILGSPDDAQDAVGKGLLSAWKAWSTGFRPDSFPSWFFVIVRNSAFAHLETFRRGGHQMCWADDELVATEQPSSVDDDVDRRSLPAALAALSEVEYQVIDCRFFEDLTISATAKLLQCPESKVKNVQRRALNRLRQELTHPKTE